MSRFQALLVSPRWTSAVFAAAVLVPLLLMVLNGWLDGAPDSPAVNWPTLLRRVLFWLPAAVAVLVFQALPFASRRWRLALTAGFAGAMLCVLLAVYVGAAWLFLG